MSLDFDYSKVDKKFTTHPLNPDRLHPVTETLIWWSLILGGGQITESNKVKVAARVLAYEASAPAQSTLSLYGETIRITGQDVFNHVGLKTNADTVTDEGFKDLIFRRLIEHRVKGGNGGLSAHEMIAALIKDKANG